MLRTQFELVDELILIQIEAKISCSCYPNLISKEEVLFSIIYNTELYFDILIEKKPKLIEV